MKELKKIVVRTFLLLLVLGLLSILYRFFLFEADLVKNSPMLINQKKVENNSQILYYGESSNFTSHPDDSVKKRISEFAAEYFPDKTFNTLDHSALHAGNYKILLLNIDEDSPVETIIVTLNLRSFNADWIYSDLETALLKNMVLIDPRYPPFINRIRLSFKNYEIKTDEERRQQVLDSWENEKLVFPYPFRYDNVIDWDWAMANGHCTSSDSTWEYSKFDLACHYIKTYAFQINVDENPRIKDYDEIVDIARENNWNLVFNLMAENVDKAQALVGEELAWLIRQNRDLLVDRYQKDGVIVVDNLEDVPDAEYIDRNWTTEHYAEKGRKIIAKNLADSLRFFYPEEYVER